LQAEKLALLRAQERDLTARLAAQTKRQEAAWTEKRKVQQSADDELNNDMLALISKRFYPMLHGMAADLSVKDHAKLLASLDNVRCAFVGDQC
jgi:hypothetical protein